MKKTTFLVFFALFLIALHKNALGMDLAEKSKKLVSDSTNCSEKTQIILEAMKGNKKAVKLMVERNKKHNYVMDILYLSCALFASHGRDSFPDKLDQSIFESLLLLKEKHGDIKDPVVQCYYKGAIHKCIVYDYLLKIYDKKFP